MGKKVALMQFLRYRGTSSPGVGDVIIVSLHREVTEKKITPFGKPWLLPIPIGVTEKTKCIYFKLIKVEWWKTTMIKLDEWASKAELCPIEVNWVTL